MELVIIQCDVCLKEFETDKWWSDRGLRFCDDCDEDYREAQEKMHA
jgi:hypothetical protein